MVTQVTDFYTQAHLITAAIRLLEHRHATPPSVDQVCDALSFSIEQGHRLCNRLKEMDIIDITSGAFGTRLFIIDHLKIEEIPRGETGSSMEAELRKFQDSQKGLEKKVETIKAEQEKKKKDMFADLEKQFKKQSKK
ncbi:MAG: hypothetical protein GY697_02970 [Desulfobacterales bacterium]|nr:hypothetical protein [Desulfobacterales bacterium]